MNRVVTWLTFRQLFARRRLWYALGFSLAPLLFTAIFRVFVDDGASDGARLDFFTGLCRQVIIGTLLPLAGVIFGTTAFGGEIDDGTLIYLLVKPVARWKIVVSKYVVAVVSTFAIALPAILLPWLLLRGADVPARVALSFLTGAGIASAAYCALSLALGLASRRALVIGLLYVIGFEGVLSRSLAGLRSFSVREHSIAIAQAVSAGTVSIPDAVSMSTVKWMGTIMLVAAMGWTMRRLVRYELAERL